MDYQLATAELVLNTAQTYNKAYAALCDGCFKANLIEDAEKKSIEVCDADMRYDSAVGYINIVVKQLGLIAGTDYSIIRHNFDEDGNEI
jgi:hypothetical protein